MTINDDGLAFFNELVGELEIQLTEQASPLGDGLRMIAAPPTAKIARVELRLQVFEQDGDEGEGRPLTEEEWNRVVLRAPTIRLRGEGAGVVEHAAPNGRWFTTRELAAAIAETERQTRGDTDWFGGVDVHHVFFEGIELDDDGMWSINWGS